MAGGVEVEKVAIAELTQEPSDRYAGGPDRVCEVLVRQADGKPMSLGGGLGEFALKQVKEFDQAIFDAAMACDGAEGFALLKASDHLAQQAFHEFGGLIDFAPGQTH